MKLFLLLMTFFVTSFPVLASEYVNPYTQNQSDTVYIPSGTIIQSRLNSNISSEQNSQNDILTTQLAQDWLYSGNIIAPEGSLIRGRITKIEKSTYALGNAKVYLSFYQVIRPDNIIININAKPICITIGESRTNNAKKLITDGILQSLSTISSVSDIKQRAINGAVAGGVTFLTTKGEEVSIPYGTAFKINILKGLSVPPYEN